MIGKVKWFNEGRGYGFITPNNGSEDVFVHHSGIVGEGHKILYEDEEVEFDIGEGHKGKCAENVKRIARATDVS